MSFVVHFLQDVSDVSSCPLILRKHLSQALLGLEGLWLLCQTWNQVGIPLISVWLDTSNSVYKLQVTAWNYAIYYDGYTSFFSVIAREN